MSKVLVTGGAGFIGSHVVDVLMAKGHHVYVVDDLRSGKRAHLPNLPETQFFQFDVRDPNLSRDLLRLRFEMVFHLAAIHFIPYCNEHPHEAFDVNFMGTYRLLEALSAVMPQKFFFASTAAIYPPSDEAHKESDAPGPMDVYGLSKLAGEVLVREFQQRAPRLGLVIGRLFNAIGSRETNPHLLPELVDQLRQGRRSVQLGNLEPKRDYIHVEDMARAIVELTLHQKAGCEVFNIGAGEQHSVREVVSCCEKILQDKIVIQQEAARIRKSERPFLLSDNHKLRRAVAWEPQHTLESTLRSLLQS